jgi:hypothetical protein
MVLLLLGCLFNFVRYGLFCCWNVIRLNGRPVVVTFLSDWMSLLFMGPVIMVSSSVFCLVIIII